MVNFSIELCLNVWHKSTAGLIWKTNSSLSFSNCCLELCCYCNRARQCPFPSLLNLPPGVSLGFARPNTANYCHTRSCFHVQRACAQTLDKSRATQIAGATRTYCALFLAQGPLGVVVVGERLDWVVPVLPVLRTLPRLA